MQQVGAEHGSTAIWLWNVQQNAVSFIIVYFAMHSAARVNNIISRNASETKSHWNCSFIFIFFGPKIQKLETSKCHILDMANKGVGVSLFLAFRDENGTNLKEYTGDIKTVSFDIF